MGIQLPRFPDLLPANDCEFLNLVPSKLLLAFKKPYRLEDIERLLGGTPLELEDAVERSVRLQLKGPLMQSSGNYDDATPQGQAAVNNILAREGLTLKQLRGTVRHTPWHVWVRSRASRAITRREIDGLPSELASELRWIGPVYRDPKTNGRVGLQCPLPHALLLNPALQLRSSPVSRLMGSYHPVTLFTQFRIARALSRYNLKKVKPSWDFHLEEDLLCALETPGEQTVYELSHKLLGSDGSLIRSVRFLNYYMLSGAALEPDDPYYKPDARWTNHQGQWNLQRIHAEEGWDIVTKKPVSPVLVAVLDYGCDLDHPDLTGQFTTGYTVPEPSREGECGGGHAEFDSDHGTLLAGVITARHNTAGVAGLAGLARACFLMPVAFYVESGPNLKKAFAYAVKNKARVICLSFNLSSSVGQVPSEKADLDTAIASAYESGVVICVAAGNDGLPHLGYPANDPNVMACGAMNQDNSHRPTSNYGPGLSVIAPGQRVPTTTNTTTNGGGPDGVDPSGSYRLTSGTSIATAHVASLAALLLSVRPDLSNVDVRNIIELTAEEVPPYKYDRKLSRYPSKGWNDKTGYGLINVEAALIEALSFPRT